MPHSDKPSVLEGVRVLDFGQYIAAPVVTRMMADMGAEIIKVELAPTGDNSRFYPYFRAGQSGGYIQHNRGKLSLCLDIKQPEGVRIVKELAPKVDVVIENFSPGTLGRYGLGYDDLKALNSRLIMCSISGFGQDGPLAHKPGVDTLAQAMSGLLHLTGDPDKAPTYVGLFIADENAGVHGLASVCAALYYREKTGRGQYIDLSLLECLFHLHDTAVQFYTLSDGKENPTRFGSHHYAVAPCGIFKASDGYVVIVVLEHQWKTFVKAVGKPEWLDDPRFDTNQHRAENRLVLVELLEQWLQSLPDPRRAAGDPGRGADSERPGPEYRPDHQPSAHESPRRHAAGGPPRHGPHRHSQDADPLLRHPGRDPASGPTAGTAQRRCPGTLPGLFGSKGR